MEASGSRRSCSTTVIYSLILICCNPLAAQQSTLAIIDFEGKGVSQIEASALTDRFRSEIMIISGSTVVERQQMDRILLEQDFQQTGCVSSECMVEMGQLLGATQIIGGSISKVGNTFSVHARIISIETGEIINSVNYDLTGVIDELLITGMRNVSQLLFATEEQSLTELGKDIEYYDSGELKAEGQSIAGTKIGRWIYYYPNGRIETVGSYKNGKRHGTWTFYYKNGRIWKNGSLYYNERNGEWSIYDEEGKLTRIEIYDSDKIRARRHFPDNNEIVYEARLNSDYLMRLLNIWSVKELYPNGAIKSEAVIRFGLIDGVRTIYTSHGEVMSKEEFKDGHGRYVDCHPNGQLRVTGKCISYDGINMKRQGLWYGFDSEGNLLWAKQYEIFTGELQGTINYYPTHQ